MPDHDKTIYKTCREAAGYTQERAAELLNLSVRQLARFEAGELIPGDDIAYGPSPPPSSWRVNRNSKSR